MKLDAKQITIATIIELAARTSSKVAINTTKRGFGEVTKEMYDSVERNLRDELAIKGATNV